ncbi:hypothetical protein [Devosia sp.]|uniref:hypothetical protein n=1 Tax=Devosia sp. TaxID=1871048 RepID=UPI002735A057|nr:hypothetical protein [Devosia sp.]MDP2781575.1 hypothetical protein [Devosia sp.]
MEKSIQRRNPMLPWWIGFVIIMAVVIYAGYRFSCLDCGAASIFPEFLVLAVVPAVYLSLMYLLFRYQAEDEAQRRK